MWPILLFIWGCIPELSKDCQDMTNSSSTYFSMAVGAVIGAVVSWWIYNRQKKTSDKQDKTLNKIESIDERHDSILEKIEELDRRHDRTLNAILELIKKMEHRHIEGEQSTDESANSSSKKDSNSN